LLLKAPGTIYEGMGLDGRPAADRSPVPYLTLRELAVKVLESRTFSVQKRTLPALGENHQRRCSTADESRLRDFACFGEPTPSPAFDPAFERVY
jgi:hypothetical protein